RFACRAGAAHDVVLFRHRIPPSRCCGGLWRRSRGGIGETCRVAQQQFVLDTTRVREFVRDVQATIDRAASAEEASDAIRPGFAELLADPEWLPEKYQAPVPGSGMGGGIGQWLLYRAGDGSLSLFSLVVPSGSATPVHDHLAWGLVGLYRGTQDEEVYAA